MVLPAVKAAPYAIAGARFVEGLAGIRSATRNHPAILGFNWDGGGGHFVVCVGPTTTDATLFWVLDPDGGLQDISSDDTVGTQIAYNPTYRGRGTIDPVGYIVT